MRNNNDCKAVLAVWSGAAFLIAKHPKQEKQIIETAKEYIDNRIWDQDEIELEVILESYEAKKTD